MYPAHGNPKRLHHGTMHTRPKRCITCSCVCYTIFLAARCVLSVPSHGSPWPQRQNSELQRDRCRHVGAEQVPPTHQSFVKTCFVGSLLKGASMTLTRMTTIKSLSSESRLSCFSKVSQVSWDSSGIVSNVDSPLTPPSSCDWAIPPSQLTPAHTVSSKTKPMEPPRLKNPPYG